MVGVVAVAVATAVVVVMVVVVVAVVVVFIFFFALFINSHNQCFFCDSTECYAVPVSLLVVTLWMHIINPNLGKIHLNCLNCCFYSNNSITYKHKQIFFLCICLYEDKGHF